MKICILSMQAVDNYGSVLQAYSLKKIVESLGHSVSFIDIKRGEDKHLNTLCTTNNIVEGHKNTFVERVKGRLIRMQFHKSFEQFRNMYLVGKANIIESKFDLCIIGSDEVFNCMQRSKWGFDPQLFGNVRCADKVITYAASCGFTYAAMLPSEVKTAVTSAMSNISAISVRDENTAAFVKALHGGYVTFNLDPVAVGDLSEEIKGRNYSWKLPKHYCIVYSYQDRMNEPWLKNCIRSYCDKHNLTPIAPFGRQSWIKPCKLLSPFELLAAFNHAEAIVTDTFHGTIFGAKFGEKMAVIIRDSNYNKLFDLVHRLGIENHIIRDGSDLDRVLNQDLDRKYIDNILLQERNATLNYLKENFVY
ncbi:polysaccharide pyruvyl transferase family protein [Hungatella sp.]|uniref:polysaccharide pyruvyl transferase family protein n=1 Tax=Hungatella sp. TaxID=2613924 RepID=UPI002A813C67|nr:polysaccharide pyruvyl transferase family protein [Hungatella sp.]